MRNPLRRNLFTPQAPAPDALIAQLSRDKAELRDQLADAGRLIAYQRDRMKDMSTELLGHQATIARYQKLAGTWGEIHAALVPAPVSEARPSTVATAVQCPACPHDRGQHDEWGCKAGHGLTACKCEVAPIHFYAKART